MVCEAGHHDLMSPTNQMEPGNLERGRKTYVELRSDLPRTSSVSRALTHDFFSSAWPERKTNVSSKNIGFDRDSKSFLACHGEQNRPASKVIHQ